MLFARTLVGASVGCLTVCGVRNDFKLVGRHAQHQVSTVVPIHIRLEPRVPAGAALADGFNCARAAGRDGTLDRRLTNQTQQASVQQTGVATRVVRVTPVRACSERRPLLLGFTSCASDGFIRPAHAGQHPLSQTTSAVFKTRLRRAGSNYALAPPQLCTAGDLPAETAGPCRSGHHADRDGRPAGGGATARSAATAAIRCSAGARTTARRSATRPAPATYSASWSWATTWMPTWRRRGRAPAATTCWSSSTTRRPRTRRSEFVPVQHVSYLFGSD